MKGTMMNIAQQTSNSEFVAFLPALVDGSLDLQRQVYENNRHRVYALAFWMTDSELAAEDLTIAAFRSAFTLSGIPSAEEIDAALIAELRQLMPLGLLELQCEPVIDVRSVRYNILRCDLERAVVQLPATEKMIFLMHDVESYDDARIARALGISEQETRQGVYQARLRLRELLAK